MNATSPFNIFTTSTSTLELVDNILGHLIFRLGIYPVDTPDPEPALDVMPLKMRQLAQALGEANQQRQINLTIIEVYGPLPPDRITPIKHLLKLSHQGKQPLLNIFLKHKNGQLTPVGMPC